MSSRDRIIKVIVIGGLSLLACIVTFGLLESSGTFKNSTINLGGSIVGFLAAAYLFNKMYGPDPVNLPKDIPEHDLGDAEFVSEDSLKLLDLSNQKEIAEDQKQTEPRNRVAYNEYYKLRKLKEASDIPFKFATTGYGMEGTCESHPGFDLVETTDKALSADENRHLVKTYEIQLKVDELAINQAVDVRHALTYISAFDGKETEWFHTHVRIPTESVTVIILFPASKLCKEVKGFGRIGEDSSSVAIPKHKGPLRFQNGKLVYWHIASPQLGASYKIQWNW